MTIQTPDTRTLAQRIQDTADGTATGKPTTRDQQLAYNDGQQRHADGDDRPAGPLPKFLYGAEMPWLVKGWDDAAEAATAAHEVSATGKPTTCQQVSDIWRGKEMHAAGKPRPTGPGMSLHYLERYPWLLRGWDEAAQAARAAAETTS